jgi:hypothetical protein
MSSFRHQCSWFAAGSLALLSLACNTFKQPAAEAPHAVAVVTFLGGELRPGAEYFAFGYSPGVVVCKGKKTTPKCTKYVEGKFEKKSRDLPFRIPAEEEVTITPLALVDSSYKNDGVTITTSRTYCYGNAHTVTAKAGDKLHYFYAYDPEKKACGSKPADEVLAEAP